MVANTDSVPPTATPDKHAADVEHAPNDATKSINAKAATAAVPEPASLETTSNSVSTTSSSTSSSHSAMLKVEKEEVSDELAMRRFQALISSKTPIKNVDALDGECEEEKWGRRWSDPLCSSCSTRPI